MTALVKPLLASWLIGVSAAVAADVAPVTAPSALTTPAATSARALRAAVLTVAQAGPRLVAAGERGAILLSDDAGRSWRQARVPVRATLTGLHFADAQRGWAVGHLGVVLHTADGGENWSLQLDGLRIAELARAAATTPQAMSAAQQLAQDGPDKPLFAVHFSDVERGWVIGAYGLALHTRDGGRTWRYMGHELPNPKHLHLYGLAVTGHQVTIAGEQGLLLASDDSGQRFRAIDPPYPGSYFGVLRAGNSIVAYGLRGTAYRSDDAGQSWQKAEVPTDAPLSAGLTLADGRLLLASQSGELLVSADQGRRFARLPAPQVPVAALAQATDGSLVLGTLRGPLQLPLPR